MGSLTTIKNYYRDYPLRTILLAALFIRLLAAFFSKGYAFHDDHFDVVRVAQNWASGLPHWLESGVPPKHSMPYAAFNSLFIWIMDATGASDPIAKTTVLRIIHAFYSLLVVYFGYKIVELLSDERKAKLTGWILALIWFMPFLSVRFLAELVCVPFVLAGFYYLIQAHSKKSQSWLPYLIAGSLFGLAFTIRLHTILFAGGLGLVLLFRKQWIQSVAFTIAYLLVASLLVGVPDIILFDYPFHSVATYFEHNVDHAYHYVKGGPFKFSLATLGFLVPPISIFLIFGYLRSFKLEPMMFIAAAVFFVFHSAFPNQQERFILPVLPLFIILGVMGWVSFYEQSSFWKKKQGLHKGFWKFFWGMNIIVGLALAFTFSKRDRIEPLYFLSKLSDVRSVIIENEKSVKQVPAYYLGNYGSDYSEFKLELLGLNKFKENKGYLDPNYKMIFTLGSDKTPETLQQEMNSVSKVPNYVVFQGERNLQERVERIKILFPNKSFNQIKVIESSNLDKLLHFLNPRVHRDQTGYIYKIED